MTNNGNNGDINRFFVRVDHHFSEKDMIWGNFSSSKSGVYTVAQAFPPGYGSWGDGGFYTQVYNGTLQHNFSPRVLNEGGFGYPRQCPSRVDTIARSGPRFPRPLRPTAGGLPERQYHGHVAIGDYGGSAATVHSSGYRQPDGNSRAPPSRPGHCELRVSSLPGSSGRTNIAERRARRFDFTGRFTNPDSSAPAQPAHAFADFSARRCCVHSPITPTAVNLFSSDALQPTCRMTGRRPPASRSIPVSAI